MSIVLKQGDACELMKQHLADESIDLTVTSPPYDTLRTYNGFQFDFDRMAKELYRVTKQGGVLVWVVGDETIKGSESGTSFRQALYFMGLGFNLHDTMIYKKNNFSNPSSTRYHQIFEYMFVLSRGKPKTFHSIKDRKNVYGGKIGSWGKNTVRQRDGSHKERPKKVNTEYGQRYNIWEFKTSKNGQDDEFAYKHPAHFPEALARDHILSWSNEGDLVFDPMVGSGTTAKMAKLLKRNFIGYDISEEYIEIARERIEKVQAGIDK